MKIISKLYSLSMSIFLKAFALLELFLFLRFLLKFLNASHEAPVVRFIYYYSGIIISPFDSIFHNIHWDNYLVDIVAVTTMIGYAVAVFIILQLLKVFSPN